MSEPVDHGFWIALYILLGLAILISIGLLERAAMQ